MQTACLVLFGALLVLAAWQDLRTLRIANSIVLGVGGSYALWALSGLALGTLSGTVLAFAVLGAAAVFAAGACAFALRGLGGGDVKLLAATGLFAGPALMADFLLVTAVAGGVLAIAILARARLGSVALAMQATATRTVPYGPAIAAGGLWVAVQLALP